jgi:hypothetical protein
VHDDFRGVGGGVAEKAGGPTSLGGEEGPDLGGVLKEERSDFFPVSIIRNIEKIALVEFLTRSCV